jgi:hypothetical protein
MVLLFSGKLHCTPPWFATLFVCLDMGSMRNGFEL